MTETLEKVEVVVDDRERPSGVVPELEKLGRVVVKIEHLSLGDCCIDAAVLIERKSASVLPTARLTTSPDFGG